MGTFRLGRSFEIGYEIGALMCRGKLGSQRNQWLLRSKTALATPTKVY